MSGFQPMAFAAMQELIATQYAAQANTPANTDPGSTLGSFINAFALLAVQQQNNDVYLQAISRLATSTGADVDTFVEPFGITRLDAAESSGTVTFSTSSPASQQLVVLTGTLVQTTGNLQFVVIADNNQTGYNASLGGYVIPAGQKTVNATVQCIESGALGNVQANQITQIYGGPGGQPVVGVSSVNNAGAFTNGRDPETDAQLKTRFTLAMSAGRVATSNALAAAVLAVQPGLTYSVGDQLNTSGGSAPGQASIVVAQLGTGAAPPTALVSAVQTAVNAVRSAGITSTVIAPSLVTVAVSATLHMPTSATSANVIAAATAAYQQFVNNIGLDPAGASTICAYFDVGMILREVANVTRVDNLLINGATADITATFGQMLIAGSCTFTASQP